jgi:hypothetical protein
MPEKYTNIPPKDIQNAIWGGCFGYEDFDTEIDIDGDKETVRDRIYDGWNRIHQVLQGWIKADKEGFIDYVMNKSQPDSRLWNMPEETE